jgi:CubicO group peptidase (beta-lactamase class C family)
LSGVEIDGPCAPRFAAVKDALAANFAEGLELGCRFTVVEAGEVVVDLRAGHADRKRTKAFDAATLAPVFSTTKAIAALLIARLVDQGKLDYGQTVASVWPGFGQAGKAAITVEQAMSHQAGLSGLAQPMDPADWFDWDAVCARLAAMAPLWPPGTASGYHPITFGYLAGEIFRPSTAGGWARRCARTSANHSGWISGSACRTKRRRGWPSCSGRTGCRTSARPIRPPKQPS